MNIVIIEDEEYVADDLELNLRTLIGGALNIIQLGSVKQAINYFKDAEQPDLIFSDISWVMDLVLRYL